MNMKVIDENCIEKQITKLFTIALENGNQFQISKQVRMWEAPFGVDECEINWEFCTKAERDEYESLSQQSKDAFDEFVEDLLL